MGVSIVLSINNKHIYIYILIFLIYVKKFEVFILQFIYNLSLFLFMLISNKKAKYKRVKNTLVFIYLKGFI